MPDQQNPDAVMEGRPWWKMCCTGCIIVFALFVVGVIILVRISPGSGPRTVSSLPEGFPETIVLYRPEAVSEIVFYPASSKNRALQAIMTPVRFFTRDRSELSTQIESSFSDFSELDTVAIHWANLDSSTDDIVRFYAGSMIQAGIVEPQMREDGSQGEVTEMVGSGTDVAMKLLIVNEPETPVVDSVSLTVEYPSPSKK